MQKLPLSSLEHVMDVNSLLKMLFINIDNFYDLKNVTLKKKFLWK